MIRELARYLLRVRFNYANPVDFQRASGLLLINGLLVVFWLVWMMVAVVPAVLTNQPLFSELAPIIFIQPLVNIALYRFVQDGRLNLAARLFTLMTLLGTAPLLTEGLIFAQTILLVLPIVAAGTLLSRRDFFLVLMVIGGIIAFSLSNQLQATAVIRVIPADVAPIQGLLISATLLLVFFFLLIFSGGLDRIARRSQINIGQTRVIAELNIELSSISKESVIYARAGDVIRQRLVYLNAQFYSLDDRGGLSRVGRGEARQMVSGASIRLSDNNNPFSQAASTKQVVVVADTDAEERRDHLSAIAHYSIILPLVYRDVLLGMLDIQSDNLTAPDNSELATLSLLATTVATAVGRARYVSNIEFSLREQEQSIERLQTDLSRLTRRGQQAESVDWARLIGGIGREAFGFNLDTLANQEIGLVPASDLPEALQQTLADGAVNVDVRGDEQIVSIPIRLRNQMIGAMSFSLPASQEINRRQLEMAQIVSDRLALALENNRLFEQSRAQAQRERKASAVAATLIGATDVNTVLQLAAESFNEALGAVNTQIYLQPEAPRVSDPTEEVL